MNDGLDALRALAREIAIAFGRYAERGGAKCADDCQCSFNQCAQAFRRFYDNVQAYDRGELLRVDAALPGSFKLDNVREHLLTLLAIRMELLRRYGRPPTVPVRIDYLSGGWL